MSMLRFNESKFLCEKFFNAQLASIHSDEEQTFLSLLPVVKENNGYPSSMGGMWIGAERKNGQWSWADGSNFDYNRFDSMMMSSSSSGTEYGCVSLMSGMSTNTWMPQPAESCNTSGMSSSAICQKEIGNGSTGIYFLF